MRLFERKDKSLTEAYPDNVFLSWGYYWPTINKHFYIRLELPFDITRTVVDPNTFYTVRGKCRSVMLVRRNLGSRKGMFFVRGWKLIDPSTATILHKFLV